MKLLVGISGGIAAYKIPELIRLLSKKNIECIVVLTNSAQEFVTPLTLKSLGAKEVYVAQDCMSQQSPMLHIDLAKWATNIIIAPATANIIAKIAHGLADDLLTNICLASNVQPIIVPAMNKNMWHHSRTVNNINILSQMNCPIWGPDIGLQACGDHGYGRMLEIKDIWQNIIHYKNEHQYEINNNDLKNQNVVITAGATKEKIDTVRYITNKSSGKMGYALAQAAAQMSAKVTLISGLTQLNCPDGVQNFKVESASEMLHHAMHLAKEATIFIGAAAVADFRLQKPYAYKIKLKSTDKNLNLMLAKNEDIISKVAHMPAHNRPFTVGFAAESENVLANAQRKLINKNLDLIIANDVSKTNIGFNSNYNQITLLNKKGIIFESNLMTKQSLAIKLMRKIYTILSTPHI